MSRKAIAKNAEKKESGRLTLAQLASYDDVLTDTLVDRVGDHKMY